MPARSRARLCGQAAALIAVMQTSIAYAVSYDTTRLNKKFVIFGPIWPGGSSGNGIEAFMSAKQFKI